jgi:hypothetical protein
MKNIGNGSAVEEDKGGGGGHGEEAYTNINILPSIHRLKASTLCFSSPKATSIFPLFSAFPNPPNPIYVGMPS